jgi:hypothetical protein
LEQLLTAINVYDGPNRWRRRKFIAAAATTTAIHVLNSGIIVVIAIVIQWLQSRCTSPTCTVRTGIVNENAKHTGTSTDAEHNSYRLSFPSTHAECTTREV